MQIQFPDSIDRFPLLQTKANKNAACLTNAIEKWDEYYALNELEKKVGVDNSDDTGSLDYKTRILSSLTASLQTRVDSLESQINTTTIELQGRVDLLEQEVSSFLTEQARITAVEHNIGLLSASVTAVRAGVSSLQLQLSLLAGASIPTLKTNLVKGVTKTFTLYKSYTTVNDYSISLSDNAQAVAVNKIDGTTFTLTSDYDIEHVFIEIISNQGGIIEE